jgi:hypothetical protein
VLNDEDAVLGVLIARGSEPSYSIGVAIQRILEEFASVLAQAEQAS